MHPAMFADVSSARPRFPAYGSNRRDASFPRFSRDQRFANGTSAQTKGDREKEGKIREEPRRKLSRHSRWEIGEFPARYSKFLGRGFRGPGERENIQGKESYRCVPLDSPRFDESARTKLFFELASVADFVFTANLLSEYVRASRWWWILSYSSWSR